MRRRARPGSAPLCSALHRYAVLRVASLRFAAHRIALLRNPSAGASAPAPSLCQKRRYLVALSHQEYTITGDSPLIVHSNCTVDPLHPLQKRIKAITDIGSKKMTESDYETLYRLKWEAAIYYGADVGPFIPGDNIQKLIREGGARSRKGKDIERACVVMEDRIPLQYAGPRDMEGLYADKRFVFIKPVKPSSSGGTVMSARPIFQSWALTFSIAVNTDLINIGDVETALMRAGAEVGLGNWRPRYGRFHINSINGKAVHND
jgi:hypothetical protein